MISLENPEMSMLNINAICGVYENVNVHIYHIKRL